MVYDMNRGIYAEGLEFALLWYCRTIEEEFAAEVHVNGATWGGPTSATGGNAKAELSNQEKGKSTSESDLIDFVPIMMESSIR